VKPKILILVSITVTYRDSVVVIDAPNVYYDKYCRKCSVRQCGPCQKEMKKLGLTKTKGKRVYADTSNKDWFQPSLDIHRLPIVIEYIEKRGHRPLFYCESSMRKSVNTWLLRKYPDDVAPKRDLLEKLFDDGYIAFDDHGMKPHGADKGEDDNWDDDIWIIHMAIRLREQLGVDSYIMSKDNFWKWKDDRKDLDWDLINSIHIKFEWQPKEAPENEEQLFSAPKLRNLTDVSPAIERKNLLRDIQMKESQIEELRHRLSILDEEDSIQEELAKFAITPTSEPDEEPETPFKEEIIDSVEKAIQSGIEGAVKTSQIWLNLKSEIVPAGLDGVGHDGVGDRLAKVKLGFKEKTPTSKVVAHMVNIYVNHTGNELKPSPDWSILEVIN